MKTKYNHNTPTLVMVLLNTNNGDIVSGEDCWMPLESLYNSTSTKILSIHQPRSNKYFLSVGVSTNECNRLWEYTEPKTKTEAEKIESKQRKLAKKQTKLADRLSKL